MPDFSTGAGATISLSASAPATYDAAGFGAVVYTAVGKVSDLGELPEAVSDIVTMFFLSSGAEFKARGGKKLGNQTITYAVDNTDAGQTLINTLRNNVDPASVKIAHPTLGTIYARALVMGGPKRLGGNSDAATKSVVLEWTFFPNGTDFILVP